MNFLDQIAQATSSLQRARQNAIDDRNGVASEFSYSRVPFDLDIKKLDNPVTICFEGIDGSGKDTQIDLLRKYLEYKQKRVYVFNSLANTEISTIVRKRCDEGITDPLTMVTLFLAELGLVHEQLLKLKETREHDYILLNRWIYSTYAYCYNGDTTGYITAGVKGLAHAYFMPDVLIMLNAKATSVMSRLKTRGEEVNETKFIHKYNVLNTRYSGFIEYARQFSKTKVLEVRDADNIKNEALDKIPGWANHVYIIHKLFNLGVDELTKQVKMYTLADFQEPKPN